MVSAEAAGNGQLTCDLAPCAVQQRHCGVNGAFLEGVVVKGHSHALTVEREGQLSLIHVQVDPQHSFLLETAPVLRA